MDGLKKTLRSSTTGVRGMHTKEGGADSRRRKPPEADPSRSDTPMLSKGLGRGVQTQCEVSSTH